MPQLINKQFTLLSTLYSKPILVDMRFKPTGKSQPLIVFCHGFKGFKDWGHFNLIANNFAAKGYIFLKFNFSHNGTTVEHPTDFVDLEAFGNNNVSKELDDLNDIIDAVMNDHPTIPEAHIDKENIFLIGHSRGGGIVILKGAEDERIKAISAWAPVHNFKERYSGDIIKQWKRDGVYVIHNSRTNQEMPLYYQMVEDIYENDDRTSIPGALRNLKKPAIAFHGTKDETLDYINTKKLREYKADIKIEIIKDGNHTFGGSHPWAEEYLPEHTHYIVERTDEFFQQNI